MNEYTVIIADEAAINAKGKKNSKHCISVIGWPVNGGEILKFSSIEDAAKYIGADYAYLSKCINADKRCKGYRFCHAKRQLLIWTKSSRQPTIT